MIAEVTLLRRMVRRLDFFDYAVPAEMESGIQVGVVVKVPFRKSIEFGIIKGVSTEPARPNLKPIGEILGPQPIFEKDQLEVMIGLAHFYGVSLSNILNLALPTLGIRRLTALTRRQKVVVEKNNLEKEFEAPLEYFLYKNEKERLNYFVDKCGSCRKAIILLPQVVGVNPLVEELTEKLPHHTIIPYHSDLTEKQRAENYFSFLENPKAVLVGTRIAAFAPLIGADRIFIDREQDDDHKSWDAAPRFDARFVMRIFALRSHVPLSFMSFSPSADSYFRVHKGFVSGSIEPSPINRATCVDISSESRFENLDLLSTNTFTRMQKCLEKNTDVLVFVNQKGVASGMYCRNCGHDLICPKCKINYAVGRENNLNYLACRRCLGHEKMPSTCPNCHSDKLSTRGAGIDKIGEAVINWVEKKQLKNKVEIISADDGVNKNKKNEKSFDDSVARIFVGTEAMLSRPIWGKAGLAVISSFDRMRNSPDYLADERAWQLITHAHYLLPETGEVIIEAREPKHYILRSLIEPHRFYRLNLNMRQTATFPPYTLLVKYMVGNSDPLKAEKSAKQAVVELKLALTKNNVSASISGPTESIPKVRNGQYYYVILAKFKPDIAFDAVAAIHRALDPEIKIDPNPMSLYNP